MTAPKGPLELVREEIMRRLGPEIDARFEQLTPILIKALNRDQPLETVPDPPAVAPATAAKRTTLQGVIALVMAGALGYATDAVSGEEFQVFDLDDWQGLGSGAVVAGLMALLAFGMRKIGR